MLTLSVLIWLSLFASVVAFWWQSDLVKHHALKLVNQHCSQLDLQLLDHTMVIRGILPVRDEHGSLRLRRTYRFEFTSTGEERYRGNLVMTGRKLQSLELEPHILP